MRLKTESSINQGLRTRFTTTGWQPSSPWRRPCHRIVRVFAHSRRVRMRVRYFATSASRLHSHLATGARSKVRQVLEAPDNGLLGGPVRVRGWLRTVRTQKNDTFLQVHDGSALASLQVVVPSSMLDGSDGDGGAASNPTPMILTTGTAVSIEGVVRESLGKGQAVEVEARKVTVVGTCDADFPMQKKRHTREVLRTMPHLRPRTNTFAAVARVRSTVALATHQHFQDANFLFIQTPLITSLDCEGAGEMFSIGTTAPPPVEASTSPPPSAVDDPGGHGASQEHFFGKPAYLTVSGQLAAESFACALGDVYTFGPTFRAENSRGSRHLAEFHMIEPELAFAGLDDVMDSMEEYVRAMAAVVLDRCTSEVGTQGYT